LVGIIAKLDRLARNVAFVSALMEAGVEFEAVDFPQANRLRIHILAAVAEHEAKVISERTKAALQAAKRRGLKLGGFRAGAKLTAKARRAGYATLAATAAAKAAVDYAGIIAAYGWRNVAEGHGSGAQRARHCHAEWPGHLAGDPGTAGPRPPRLMAAGRPANRRPGRVLGGTLVFSGTAGVVGGAPSPTRSTKKPKTKKPKTKKTKTQKSENPKTAENSACRRPL
jgi:Resolvase, N terminal domain